MDMTAVRRRHCLIILSLDFLRGIRIWVPRCFMMYQRELLKEAAADSSNEIRKQEKASSRKWGCGPDKNFVPMLVDLGFERFRSLRLKKVFQNPILVRIHGTRHFILFPRVLSMHWTVESSVEYLTPFSVIPWYCMWLEFSGLVSMIHAASCQNTAFSSFPNLLVL